MSTSDRMIALTWLNRRSGIALAMAAASLFLSVSAVRAAQEEAVIHCAGVNACKGKDAAGQRNIHAKAQTPARVKAFCL